MKKPLPIGISDFKRVIEGNYAYVDKTLFVEELMERGSVVSLIPRPRRFGKTLNLSMLQYFFEKGEEDTKGLFSSLNIWKKQKYRDLQGQFPVVFFSLKDIKFASWQETFEALCALIAKEFGRHRYLLDGNVLLEEEKEDFNKILHKKGSQTLCAQSLRLLTEWLHRYHKKRVILLIDEYDTPAHSAFFHDYYDVLISFLRNWLSGGLKDNSFLEKGVLTGILRIAKESIFSGLNNISTFTILNEEFQDKFGLQEAEVKNLLEDYGLLSVLPKMKQWYDGYRIGSCEGIYNPWSVLNCISKNGLFAPYWVNTSENTLMKQLMTEGSDTLKEDLESLMSGEIIEKHIDEGVVFTKLKWDTDAIWSLLLLSGYLTITETPSYGVPCKLRIPNIEVGELYRSMVQEWFANTISRNNYNKLLKSLTEGDVATFSQLFEEFVMSSFSVFDIGSNEPEKVYHMFVLGMLIGLEDHYEVKSNRESGLGRYDVMLIPKNPKDLGIIIEFKKLNRYDTVDREAAAQLALKQIEDKYYAQELRSRGIHRILNLGIVFEGKQVLVRSTAT